VSGNRQESNCQVLPRAFTGIADTSRSMVKYAEQNNRARDCRHADKKWS